MKKKPPEPMFRREDLMAKPRGDAVAKSGEKPVTTAGKLLYRVDGENWVALYSMSGKNENLQPVASIRVGAVFRVDRRKEFQRLVRNIIGDAIEELTGKRPTWSSEEKAK